MTKGKVGQLIFYKHILINVISILKSSKLFELMLNFLFIFSPFLFQ